MNDAERPRWPLARRVELVQDVSAISPPLAGYLRRHRHRIKTVFDDGSRSETYVADYIDRDASRRDAIALAVYTNDPSGDPAEARILLRRQLRYAAYAREQRPLTTEVIAGLIEHGEPPADTALRELWEEAGLELEPAKLVTLGPSFFMLPGIFTERIVPLAVEVPNLERALDEAPPGDGSPFEEGAELIVLSLGDAFALIESPPPADPTALSLDDAKTEIVLARLWRLLESQRR